jgi:hypothetical protein
MAANPLVSPSEPQAAVVRISFRSAKVIALPPETVAELNGKLPHRGPPFNPSPPAQAGIFNGGRAALKPLRHLGNCRGS